MENLLRVNKITAQFVGEGVMVASFYKTHDKLGQVKSTDEAVKNAGFVEPQSVPASEGVEPVEVTPNQKLEAFKEFLGNNATIFGYIYDPVDRRPEGNKFPSKYNEESLLTTAHSVLKEKIGALAESIQNGINTMIKNGHMAEGSVIEVAIGIGAVNVSEKYKDESLKYADVKFPVEFKVGDKAATIEVPVQLVSGQLKKPRELGDQVFTVTGLRTALTNAGVLPKIEKPVKEEVAEGIPTAEPCENGACPTEAQ